MDDYDAWLVKANDAVKISLLSPSPSGLTPLASFHPKFTHQIFGEDEVIWGYKGLEVNLRYRANDMRPHVEVRYSKKYQTPGGQQVQDIKETLKDKEHLPPIAFVKESDFTESSVAMPEDWTPVGKLQASMEAPDGAYEIWMGNLADQAVKQLVDRFQILVKFLVDAGQYIGRDVEGNPTEQADLKRWTVFFIYNKQLSKHNSGKFSYTLMGYATVYSFFWFQPKLAYFSLDKKSQLPPGDFDFTEAPSRIRLSQFLIMPPFQAKGHGSRLYKTIFNYYLHLPQCMEFTVEDPNEAFDDLRDLCDLAFLRTIPRFNDLKINASVKISKQRGILPRNIFDEETIAEIKKETKLSQRQIARLVEMHTMSKLPTSVRPNLDPEQCSNFPPADDKHQYTLWGLKVKGRLLRHNQYELAELEFDDRLQKLEETLANVAFDYARLLDLYARREDHETPKAKRELEGPQGGSALKKARIEDVIMED